MNDMQHAIENAKGWLGSIEEMLETEWELAAQAAGWAGPLRDQRIEESVLSVMVRDGWRAPGADREPPEEYEILLATGGPALRIFGTLDQHCQPATAELQMQDWGTPWTRYPAPEETLLRFASVFWFGE